MAAMEINLFCEILIGKRIAYVSAIVNTFIPPPSINDTYSFILDNYKIGLTLKRQLGYGSLDANNQTDFLIFHQQIPLFNIMNY
jgi:hypothetical protein